MLRPLADAPDAAARTRHNLALVYGLMGAPDIAAGIVADDLPPEAIAENFLYYARLRELVAANGTANDAGAEASEN